MTAHLDVEKSSRKIRKELDLIQKVLDKLKNQLDDLQKNKPKSPRKGFLLAPGHQATTLPGSLYGTILRVMAEFGRLSEHEKLFPVVKTKAQAEDLIKKIGVEETMIVAKVSTDPQFEKYKIKRTERLHRDAANGDLDAIRTLASPKICIGGKWFGDFETAFGVLRQGHCPKNTESRRNLGILHQAGLLFDTFAVSGKRVYVMYPRSLFPIFSKIKTMLPAVFPF